MKIRKGFVSNSSSTSFCIYGISAVNDEMVKKILGISEDSEDVDVYDLLDEKLENEKDIEMNSNDSTYWIGRSYTTIKDDETGKQFKDSTELTLKKLFPDVTDDMFGIFKEIWYDG